MLSAESALLDSVSASERRFRLTCVATGGLRATEKRERLRGRRSVWPVGRFANPQDGLCALDCPTAVTPQQRRLGKAGGRGGLMSGTSVAAPQHRLDLRAQREAFIDRAAPHENQAQQRPRSIADG